jgi:hypothetical protein
MVCSTNFREKCVELEEKLNPEINVHSAFILSLRDFALKIGMTANYEKCVAGDKEKLLYW